MDTERLFPLVEQHLLSQSEPEMLLLKDHLILEQCLNQVLRGYMADSNALDKLSLSFSRKLELLVALGHRNFTMNQSGAASLREIIASATSSRTSLSLLTTRPI